MGSTSTNEGVGLRVGICVKQTPKSPFLKFRRKAIESFSCYRWVFQVCRLERGGGTGHLVLLQILVWREVPSGTSNLSADVVGSIRGKKKRKESTINVVLSSAL